MDKSQALALLLEKNTAARALRMALSLMHWDAATTGVPELSLPARGEAAGFISGELFRRFMAEDTWEALETLEAVRSELSESERAMVRDKRRAYKKNRAVPPEEMAAFSALTTEAERVLETARERRDFDMIAPYYEKIFDFERRLCDWYGYEAHPYDALLDDYEQGASVAALDSFFGAVRHSIVPLLKNTPAPEPAPEGRFDADMQRDMQPWLCDFVGYDRKRGKTGEVEHPFCSTICRHDVRITSKFHEDNPFSAIYSTIHESGHALYEQNMAEALEPYDLADCASMGMHESQSRLYENMIGRSRAFIRHLLPQLVRRFDAFAGWDEDRLYRAVNAARPSLIRIEADELTYCLHVLVRYELEKALIEGSVRVRELPGLWADKYEEVLGVRPAHVGEGVLQDVHWSAGLVGYFPSYAIGNAYAAQLMAAMRRTVEVDAAIAEGSLAPVNAWLCDKVHRHGRLHTPEKLLQMATGKAFDPQDYVNYLTEKFTALL